MGHLPRLWTPNQVMHGVIRTSDGAFYLKPTQAVRNIIGACIGRALKNHPINLHGCMANTNHIHLLMSVTEETLGTGSAFFHYLDGILAKALNKHWERTGPLWGGRIRLEPCVDDNAAEAMLAYAMSNPVKDDLVEKLSDWKGFSTHKQLLMGKTEEFEYVDLSGWWAQGGPRGCKTEKDFARKVTVQTTPLPHWEHLSPKERQERYATVMAASETMHNERRLAEGKHVLGMPVLIRQDHSASPRKRPAKKRKPLCHASCKETWLSFMTMWKGFLNAYREASAFYRRGILDMEFPVGCFRPPLVTITGPPQ